MQLGCRLLSVALLVATGPAAAIRDARTSLRHNASAAKGGGAAAQAPARYYIADGAPGEGLAVDTQCALATDKAAGVRCCGNGFCVSLCEDPEPTTAKEAQQAFTDYADAKFLCSTQRLKLCTRKDLMTNVCANTGCSFDEAPVWTSETCELAVQPVSIASTTPPTTSSASTTPSTASSASTTPSTASSASTTPSTTSSASTTPSTTSSEDLTTSTASSEAPTPLVASSKDATPLVASSKDATEFQWSKEPPPSSEGYFSAATVGDRNNFTGEVGIRFVPKKDLLVSSLGRAVYADGRLSTEAAVSLWRCDPQELIASTVIGASSPSDSSGFAVEDITPVLLSADAEYRLSQTASAGMADKWYDGSAPYESPVATFLGGCSSSEQTSYPSSVDGEGRRKGMLNFYHQAPESSQDSAANASTAPGKRSPAKGSIAGSQGGTHYLSQYRGKFCTGTYVALELTLGEMRQTGLPSHRSPKVLCNKLELNSTDGTFAVQSCAGDDSGCPEACDCPEDMVKHFHLNVCVGGWLLLKGPAPNDCAGEHAQCTSKDEVDVGLARWCDRWHSAHDSGPR